MACSISNFSSRRHECRLGGNFCQNGHITPILAQISSIFGPKLPKMGNSGTMACSISKSSSQLYECRFEGHFRQNWHITPTLAQMSPILSPKIPKMAQSGTMTCSVSNSSSQRYVWNSRAISAKLPHNPNFGPNIPCLGPKIAQNGPIRKHSLLNIKIYVLAIRMRIRGPFSSNWPHKPTFGLNAPNLGPNIQNVTIVNCGL